MARTSMLSPEMLAAFNARGGTVRRVETGEGHGFTDRQWYAASQGRLDLNRKISPASENEAERLQERVREAYHVGGRAAAIDALNGEEI